MSFSGKLKGELLVNMSESVSEQDAKKILETLEKANPETAKRVRKEMRVPKKEIPKKVCSQCGQLKEVYGLHISDYSSVQDLPDEKIVFQGERKYLRPDDQVGEPICESCANELRDEWEE